ncbi:MAG: folate-binding protein YgfZ [Proteobacteria bacterium]|nr:folate-binding protein YgfZ [Pseudomonadota bacterium]
MYQLVERKVLSIKGADAFSFLQGLLTQDITLAAPDKLIYAFALTPQGKILFDCFITQTSDNQYLLDLPAFYFTEALAHLQAYKLRSKVEFIDLSDSYSAAVSEKADNPELFPDPRVATLWPRGIVASEKSIAMPDAAKHIYHEQRIIAKIADFDADIEPSAFFPAHLGLTDAAVSYNKGCYIGQEVTARLRWQGRSRKKLYILQLPQGHQRGTEVLQHNKKVGVLLGGINTAPSGTPGYMALAIMRDDLFNESEEVSLRANADVI